MGHFTAPALVKRRHPCADVERRRLPRAKQLARGWRHGPAAGRWVGTGGVLEFAPGDIELLRGCVSLPEDAEIYSYGAVAPERASSNESALRQSLVDTILSTAWSTARRSVPSGWTRRTAG